MPFTTPPAPPAKRPPTPTGNTSLNTSSIADAAPLPPAEAASATPPRGTALLRNGAAHGSGGGGHSRHRFFPSPSAPPPSAAPVVPGPSAEESYRDRLAREREERRREKEEMAERIAALVAEQHAIKAREHEKEKEREREQAAAEEAQRPKEKAAVEEAHPFLSPPSPHKASPHTNQFHMQTPPTAGPHGASQQLSAVDRAGLIDGDFAEYLLFKKAREEAAGRAAAAATAAAYPSSAAAMAALVAAGGATDPVLAAMQQHLHSTSAFHSPPHRDVAANEGHGSPQPYPKGSPSPHPPHASPPHATEAMMNGAIPDVLQQFMERTGITPPAAGGQPPSPQQQKGLLLSPNASAEAEVKAELEKEREEWKQERERVGAEHAAEVAAMKRRIAELCRHVEEAVAVAEGQQTELDRALAEADELRWQQKDALMAITSANDRQMGEIRDRLERADAAAERQSGHVIELTAMVRRLQIAVDDAYAESDALRAQLAVERRSNTQLAAHAQALTARVAEARAEACEWKRNERAAMLEERRGYEARANEALRAALQIGRGDDADYEWGDAEGGATSPLALLGRDGSPRTPQTLGRRKRQQGDNANGGSGGDFDGDTRRLLLSPSVANPLLLAQVETLAGQKALLEAMVSDRQSELDALSAAVAERRAAEERAAAAVAAAEKEAADRRQWQQEYEAAQQQQRRRAEERAGHRAAIEAAEGAARRAQRDEAESARRLAEALPLVANEVVSALTALKATEGDGAAASFPHIDATGDEGLRQNDPRPTAAADPAEAVAGAFKEAVARAHVANSRQRAVAVLEESRGLNARKSGGISLAVENNAGYRSVSGGSGASPAATKSASPQKISRTVSQRSESASAADTAGRKSTHEQNFLAPPAASVGRFGIPTAAEAADPLLEAFVADAAHRIAEHRRGELATAARAAAVAEIGAEAFSAATAAEEEARRLREAAVGHAAEIAARDNEIGSLAESLRRYQTLLARGRVSEVEGTEGGGLTKAAPSALLLTEEGARERYGKLLGSLAAL